MILPYAYTTGTLEDGRHTSFSVHASIEASTPIHFTLSAFVPSSTAAEPTVRAYRLPSAEDARTTAQCSLTCLLSRLAHTVTWVTAPSSQDVPRGHCAVCGGGAGPSGRTSGTVRALRLALDVHGNEKASVVRHPMQLALANAHWHKDSHVSVDLAVLVSCGCLFLLRVHLPLTDTAPAPSSTRAPELGVARVEAALRFPLTLLSAPSTSAPGESPSCATPPVRNARHVSMMTTPVPERKARRGTASPTVRVSASSRHRLHVLVSLNAVRLCVLECTSLSDEGDSALPWTIERLGALSMALHHAHPFHLFGRCTHLRNVQWLPGATDFTGTSPLVAALHQHAMREVGTGEAEMEPVADHLALASLLWRSSRTVPCTWQQPHLTRAPSPSVVFPTELTLSAGVLTDGPWMMKHLSLTASASFLLHVPEMNVVGLFLREPSIAHRASPLLRVAAATQTQTTVASPTSPHTAHSSAYCFRLVDIAQGTLVADVPVLCAIESAASLAVHWDSGEQLPWATVAVLGDTPDKPSSRGATLDRSEASALTRTLMLVHVKARRRSGDVAGGTATEPHVDLVYATLPAMALASVRVVGGWWHAGAQRGRLRLQALIPRREDGALMWTDSLTVSLSMVAGRLDATVASSASPSAQESGRPLAGMLRPFILADLLSYHHAMTASLQEVDMLAGSPSDDALGLEIVCHTCVSGAPPPLTLTSRHGDACANQDAVRDVVLLRNGLFVALMVDAPDKTASSSCGDGPGPQVGLRVLGRLQWPIRVPLPSYRSHESDGTTHTASTRPATTAPPADESERVLSHQMAVEALLSSEQDAVMSAAMDVSGSGSASSSSPPSPRLVMICVAKGWALLLDPESGEVSHAVRLCMDAGFTPSQMTLTVLDAPLTLSANGTTKVRTCAALCVSGVRVLSDDAPDAADGMLEPFLATLTLTQRVYQPLPPIVFPFAWLAHFASGPMRAEVASQQEKAQTVSSTAHGAQYDLTPGDAVRLGLEHFSDIIRTPTWFPPVFLLTDEQHRVDLPNPLFRLCLVSSSSRGAVWLSARLRVTAPPSESGVDDGGQGPFPLAETQRVELTSETPSAAPTSFLGASWPVTDAVLFTTVLPLSPPSSTAPTDAGTAHAAVIVAHHRRLGRLDDTPASTSDAGGRSGMSAEETSLLVETVLLAWPDRVTTTPHEGDACCTVGGGSVYTLYEQPLEVNSLGQPAALRRTMLSNDADASASQDTIHYSIGVATRDVQSPLRLSVNWRMATSSEGRTSKSEETLHWRGPLPSPLPSWISLVAGSACSSENLQ